MKVHLRSHWFGPNGHLYYKDEFGQGTEIPNELLDALPKTAKRVEAPIPPPAPPKAPTLIEADEARQALDAIEDMIVQKSAEDPQAKRAAFEAKLKAEGLAVSRDTKTGKK